MQGGQQQSVQLHHSDDTKLAERTSGHPLLRRSERADGTRATTWVPPLDCRYRGWRLAAKRAIDAAVSLVLLLLFLPVFIVLVAAVRMGSTGPILFRQDRAGRGGAPFPMLKFRSMYTDAEARLIADPELFERYVANNYKLPESEDPRVTPLGAFLRKSSLDELPQLLNVLRGQMSLVGPRPVVMHELETHRGNDAYVFAKPGITGPWQVEARSSIGYPERCEYDNDYVRDWSLTRDAMLLLRTIPAVITRRGAH